MRIYKNFSELDVANLTLGKFAGLAVIGNSINEIELPNDFLARNLGEHIESYLSDDDGVFLGLNKFRWTVPFEASINLFSKIKRLMAEGVKKYTRNDKADLKAVYSEIAELIVNSRIIPLLREFIAANPDERLYWNKSALKNRGWTDAMIRDFLGEADISDVPGCGFGVNRSHYLVSRVETAEKTSDFKTRKAKRKRKTLVSV